MRKVTAVADDDVPSYRAVESATATKTPVAILDTPASVQVVTQEVLDDQQVRNLDQAVKNVSGVFESMGPDGNTADNFVIRGFAVDHYGSSYRDGVKDFSRAPAEIAGIERVEVLKGPAAILYGRLEPGGLINRVSKKPLSEGFTEVQQQIGTDKFLRTTLDSTGQLGADSLLYRVNVAYEDSDGFKDFTYNKRVFVAPQVSWLLREGMTRIDVGVEYIDDERSWALTYGTVGDANGPVDIHIETNLHEKGDLYWEESYAYRANVTHAFNDRWQLRSQLSYFDRQSRARGSWIDAPDTAGNYERTYWGWDDETVLSKSANLEVLGQFGTGPIEHTLLIGTDYYSEDHDSGGWSYGGTPVLSNIYNPVYTNNPAYLLDRDIDVWAFSNKHTGFYAQDQMSLLGDRLHIMLGVRRDDAEYSVNYSGSGGAPENQDITYRAGVLFKPTAYMSYYVSFVEGFGAPQFDWTSGDPFEPQTSEQYEIGAKFALASNASLTIAYFDLVKDNLTRTDPLDPTITTLAGEASSNGIEIDLSGNITDNIKAMLAYAYTNTEWTSSDYYQGESFVGVPKHGASVWLTYRASSLPLKLGAGAAYRSDRRGLHESDYLGQGLAPYTLDAYTLVDAMIGYDFLIGAVNVGAQLNVINAFDKRYYPSTYYGSINRIELGTPRSVVLALKATF